MDNKQLIDKMSGYDWHDAQTTDAVKAAQKKKAHAEAKMTWVSPLRLTIVFIIALAVTFFYNGL